MIGAGGAVSGGRSRLFSRFNPCKGFGVIGAREFSLHIQAQARFNPCKGFGVIGAWISSGCPIHGSTGFNPCKGFGVIGALY